MKTVNIQPPTVLPANKESIDLYKIHVIVFKGTTITTVLLKNVQNAQNTAKYGNISLNF